MRLSWALLVMGEMGKSAEISLKSILATDPHRICIVADFSGNAWIKDLCGSKYSEKLCLHTVPDEILLQIGCSVESKSKYFSFGKSEFVRLTALKWLLIKESLKCHLDLEGVLFSDLDVLYLRSPQQSISELPSSTIVAIQDDSTQNNRHYCTGVMYWRKCEATEIALVRLFEQQLSLNAFGNLTPDEPVFNRNYNKLLPEAAVKPLNPGQFIIGHRFFNLPNKGSRDRQVVCFHANYVIGQTRKYIRLRCIELWNQRSWRWLNFYFLALLDWALMKSRNLMCSLRFLSKK